MTVALVGYGALGRQIRYLLETAGKKEFLTFDDPAFARKEPNAHAFKSCLDPEYAQSEFYICLGYLHLEQRREWLKKLLGLGRKLPPLVHSSSFVSSSAKIGQGVIIYPGCNVDQSVIVKDG